MGSWLRALSIVFVVSAGSFGSYILLQGKNGERLTAEAERGLRESVRLLRLGGLLFVYGIPHDLAFVGEQLSRMRDETQEMVFKYWIVLDIDDAPRTDFLKPSHQGLLMFLKSRPGGKTASRFHLNNSQVRIPHQKCSACGDDLKDWGASVT